MAIVRMANQDALFHLHPIQLVDIESEILRRDVEVQSTFHLVELSL
jgi:hypothetical protein